MEKFKENHRCVFLINIRLKLLLPFEQDRHLEIKMESQINSLETRIENMQERFNKDLEEIKKSQYIMNNAVNEI